MRPVVPSLTASSSGTATRASARPDPAAGRAGGAVPVDHVGPGWTSGAGDGPAPGKAPGGSRRAAGGAVSWTVLAAVSSGGALGALARYGLAAAFPSPHRGFPWATFATNVSGCLLIGVLMVLVGEVWAAHRLLRPFLGIGLLGGYTTFSTYTVEVQRLVAAGAAGTALRYLAGTLCAALVAVYAGMAGARLVIGVRTLGRPRRRDREAR